MAFCPTQLHWATLDQKASGGSPRLSDLNALTPNGAEASKRCLSPPTQRRVIMNKLLLATIALVTVFSTPASAMPGPGSPPRFRDIPDVSRHTPANPEHPLVQ